MTNEILNLKKTGSEQEHTSPHASQNPKEAEHNTALLSWHAEEYCKTHRHPKWFWALGAITGTLVIIALFLLQNYFFAFFLVIAGLLIGWFAVRIPRTIRFGIVKDGIMIDQRLHEFKEMKSFWIFYDPPLFNELSIVTKKVIMPHLVIQLGEMPSEKIRNTLRQFLLEE